MGSHMLAVQIQGVNKQRKVQGGWHGLMHVVQGWQTCLHVLILEQGMRHVVVPGQACQQTNPHHGLCASTHGLSDQKLQL